MKKVAIMMMLAMMTLVGCGAEQEYEPVEEVVEVEADYYTMFGRYYDEGYVCDEFGEVWEFWWETDEEVYDGMPVKMIMSDSGTDLLYDDEVLELVYDRETAIYDALEDELGEVDGWDITRDGNTIHIGIEE